MHLLFGHFVLERLLQGHSGGLTASVLHLDWVVLDLGCSIIPWGRELPNLSQRVNSTQLSDHQNHPVFITDLVDDPLHLECLEDVGAVADAVLHDEDEDGDERQDDHVHRVQPLTYPGRKESSEACCEFLYLSLSMLELPLSIGRGEFH